MLRTAEPLLRLEEVTGGYDGVSSVIVDSLEVRSGDYLGIVGPSGAGKTTLLKLMAGSLPTRTGTVRRGVGVSMGYVPQVETINWNFPVTVAEVVLMAARYRWRPTVEHRIRARELLVRLGVGGLEDRHIRRLSGGQQQRVFVARALMGAPSILLLDEPAAGVDVATRHQVLHLLHDLNHDEGTAIVLTTHDLNGIGAHMHDLVCLNGRVIASGHPADILTPETLEATYGAPMDVLVHGGMPVVVDHLESETRAESPLGSEHHDHEDHA